MAAVTTLSEEDGRAPLEIVRAAITQYVREQGVLRSPHSVKVGSAGKSVSVTAEPHPSVSLVERKRLSASTSGIWKDRNIDGIQYQVKQRLEW
ncbi:hypothetical protein [Massilia glaciei]|uniref:hypothetical protein n=1 Tax=Massilia glaciei TaxID=1524097 RepID=UPI0011B26A99|nr:hypothetical protein [Massilia glaciei]